MLKAVAAVRIGVTSKRCVFSETTLLMFSICKSNVHITNGKSSKGGQCLGQQGLCLKHSIVFGPDSAHCCLVRRGCVEEEEDKTYGDGESIMDHWHPKSMPL